jgi:hypothetical protein
MELERVWKYIPAEVLRPAQVTVDGKGGVTQARFDELVLDAWDKARLHLRARFDLELPDETELDPKDAEYVKDAVAALIAGYILRRLPAYQTLYKDAFAEGFASLDEWALQKKREAGLLAGPSFVEDGFEAGFPKL